MGATCSTCGSNGKSEEWQAINMDRKRNKNGDDGNGDEHKKQQGMHITIESQSMPMHYQRNIKFNPAMVGIDAKSQPIYNNRMRMANVPSLTLSNGVSDGGRSLLRWKSRDRWSKESVDNAANEMSNFLDTMREINKLEQKTQNGMELSNDEFIKLIKLKKKITNLQNASNDNNQNNNETHYESDDSECDNNYNQFEKNSQVINSPSSASSVDLDLTTHLGVAPASPRSK